MEKFSKAQFLESKKFQIYRDVISVILEDDTAYTIPVVEKKIEEFMKAEVI